MSARSRYLEAISPRNENRDDDVVIVSPSSISQQQRNHQGGVNNNNNSGAVHAFLNHSNDYNNNSGNNNNYNGSSGPSMTSNAAPPPPPPPGMPVKRKKNTSKQRGNDDDDDPPKSSSPVRVAGEQWSPREEIQSGNVQKYKNMIWGGNNNKTAAAGGNNHHAAPESPVRNAVKNYGANSPNATTATSMNGRPPPPSSNNSPSRPTPFYKRTAPPPIVTGAGSTTPNRPTAAKVTSSSSMPTPPSRVGVRSKQQRGLGGASAALPISDNNNVGFGSNGKPATPLQQRRGNLNIAPLVTNFVGGSGGGGGMKALQIDERGGNPSSAGNVHVVRTGNHQPKQPPSSSPQPYASPSHNPSSPTSKQQQGITTITSFKRPNHKVGIIFTRQSSTSPDIAIIARILPESIFAHHNEAEKKRNSTSSSSGAASGGKGLEGSEVIAVNGVPVRNPRHAAEMVAKAIEEVRLTISKKVVDNSHHHLSAGANVGGVKKSGVVVGGRDEQPPAKYTTAGRSGGVDSKQQQQRTSPVFSPKVPELEEDSVGTDVHSPQSRQEEEEGRRNSRHHHQQQQFSSPQSIDEESTFSVRTEGPEQQQQPPQQRKGMESMADELTAVTETADNEPLHRKEPMFAVNKKKQQQRDVDSAAAAAAKKSKEIADMRRKVAQAMLMSQEMVHDPVDDGNNDDDFDSEEDSDWAAPQQFKKTSPAVKTKKKLAVVAPPPQSPKSPSIAEQRRQAALDMYNSQEMVGDNVDDTMLGTTDVVVGRNKDTIGGGGGGGIPPPMPMKDMDRVNSFGNLSVASKARTDITTESMKTQQMGSTSPKVVATSHSGEEETFQFEEDGEIESKAVSMMSPPVESRRVVKREPEEVVAAASAVAAGAMQELQRQRAVVKTREDNSATVSRSSAVAPPSPARETVQESPGRKGLFGKIKGQKKMFGGVKKMLKPQKFKKSKAADRGIPLEDSNSNEEGRLETVEPTTSLQAVAVVAPPVVVPAPVVESQVLEPTEDLFAAPPDQSNSWGDDFFKDPFANSPFNDPASGDPYAFPETERARNGDNFGFDNMDSWGEPQTLPDVKSADSIESNGEMSEITNPSFISRKTAEKKETNLIEGVTESKENYSTENKSAFARGQPEALHENTFAKEQAEAMRSRFLSNEPPSPKLSPTADPLISEMETYLSSGEVGEDKFVSNLTAKSRIISKYGKNRRDMRTPPRQNSITPPRQNESTPPRQNASRPPAAHQSPLRGVVQQDAKNELALAREQAIARQRELDIAAAKAKQTGAIASSSRSPPRRNRKPLAANSSSPTKSTNIYPRQKKRAPPSALDNPNYYSVENYLLHVKDPIERAGVRLLWAAAIPIQTQARRFLARQHAIKKMCAVLTIQSFVRRWNAERNLEIAVWSAIQIQAAFRGWFARDSLEDNHYCATQIQRITRGYLATMHVFEDLYSITIVQSVVRRFLAINVAVDRLSSIIAIQAWYRGIRARNAADEKFYSALAIQTTWRRYMCQMTYQFDIIDIIIVQSVVRRRQAMQLRKRIGAVVRIQAFGRTIIAMKKYVAAKATHDLVMRHKSATKIQTCWRSYSAQMRMLMTIVNIIVIQSVWRRRAVEKIYKPHLHRIKLAKERKRQNAAIKIQSAWRGFAAFSGYTILRYENQAATLIQSQWRAYLHSTNYCIMLIEIVRIQALVRGRQERSWLAFQNECASIIQAAMRGYLTRKELHNESMISILISAAATSLRTRNAARTLQRWWVETMWTRKQKKSALIIERFFIYVKKEVEKEIKAMKKKKRQKKKMKKYMQSDDWLLENAWQGLEAAVSVENSVALQPAAAPAVPMNPYDRGQQQQQYVDNRVAHAGMSPSMTVGGALPQTGGAPSMSGLPPQAANYSVHAATNHSIQRNNPVRQQHGYRGRRYDRTNNDSMALDAAFDEAAAHDSHVVSSTQYQQRPRSRSKGYRGRRYN